MNELIILFLLFKPYQNGVLLRPHKRSERGKAHERGEAVPHPSRPLLNIL